MTEPVAHDPHPELTAAMVKRVRKMMLIAGLTTAIGVGALLIVIGYRLFRTEGSVVLTQVTTTLPKGAKIISTAVTGDRILLTLDVGGSIEIRSYDARTFLPLGQLKFVSEP
jgi:hypothetical protein